MDFKYLVFYLILLFSCKKNNSSEKVSCQAKDSLEYTSVFDTQFTLRGDFAVKGNDCFIKECLKVSRDTYYFIFKDSVPFDDFLLKEVESVYLQALSSSSDNIDSTIKYYAEDPFTTDVFIEKDTLIVYMRNNKVKSINYIYKESNFFNNTYFKIGMKMQDFLDDYNVKYDELNLSKDETRFVFVNEESINSTGLNDDRNNYMEFVLTFKNLYLKSLKSSESPLVPLVVNRTLLNYSLFNEH